MNEYIFFGIAAVSLSASILFEAEMDNLSKIISGPCSGLDQKVSVVKATGHVDTCLEQTSDLPTTEQFEESTQSISKVLSDARNIGKDNLFNSDVKAINQELSFIREELIDRGDL